MRISCSNIFVCPVCSKKNGFICSLLQFIKHIRHLLLHPGIFLKLIYRNHQSGKGFEPGISSIQRLKNTILENCKYWDEKTSYRLFLENEYKYFAQFKSFIERDKELKNKNVSFTLCLVLEEFEKDEIKNVITDLNSQSYKGFELIILCKNCTDDSVLLDAGFERIDFKVATYKDLAEEINDQISKINTDYFCILKPGIRLSQQLFLFCSYFAFVYKPDIIYSDEDCIIDQKRAKPFFKPDWNENLFYSFDYLSGIRIFRSGHEYKLTVAEKSEQINFDLVISLLAVSRNPNIFHIPLILFHDHNQDAFKIDKQRPEMLKSFLLKQKTDIESINSLSEAFLMVSFKLPKDKPLVSIIIPTRNKAQVLKKCIKSILAKTDYPNYEILLVDNKSDEKDVTDYYDCIKTKYAGKIKLLSYTDDFNYSAINNFASKQADGSLICFLNNDTEVIHKEWLNEMVSQILRPGIGIVGAKLFYPDNRIQHVGVVVGLGGLAGHPLRGESEDTIRNKWRTECVQEVLAVTGACMMIKKKIFIKVGEFDQNNLKVAYNDVDLCLKTYNSGCKILWTPFARLIHHEYISRGNDMKSEQKKNYIKEADFFKNKWKQFIEHDPYYNPNLTIQREDMRFTLNPRYKF